MLSMHRFNVLTMGAIVAALIVATSAVDSSNVGPSWVAQRPAPIDQAFARFWSAADPDGARRAGGAIVASGIGFDDAWTRLRRGRTYSAKVETGLVLLANRTGDGIQQHYAIRVPADYDAAHPLPVRVQLHGGVAGRSESQPPRPGPNRIEGEDRQIYLLPSGWAGAAWWHERQVENLTAILDRLRRTYNVDENLTYVAGISDGGTGAYYLALRMATPWSSVVPLNGHLAVLASRDVGAEGALFIGNLVNKPFYVVNGGLDRLYPAAGVVPYIDLLQQAGVPVTFRPQPKAGHDVSWWPTERTSIETFVRTHPRDPLPDRVSWQTDRVDSFNRAHWLVIDKLGPVDGETVLESFNTVRIEEPYEFGMRVEAASSGGLRVTQILKGTDADAMGLKRDDRIGSVDGTAVSSVDELVAAMQRHPAGSVMRFAVTREGRPVHTEIAFPPAPKPARAVPLFRQPGRSGRVDLVRTGNVVNARTQGVQAFTLLISPDDFAFDKPVQVVANGRVVFDGSVKKDLETLIKWAAADNDRTMLFAAEVRVDLRR